MQCYFCLLCWVFFISFLFFYLGLAGVADTILWLLGGVLFLSLLFNNGTRFIPKYMYDSFWVRVGKFQFRRWYFVLERCLVLVWIFYEHLVVEHLERLISMCEHFANFWSLRICGCIAWISFVIILRSPIYVAVVHVIEDVVKWYPRLSFSNHLRSGS